MSVHSENIKLPPKLISRCKSCDNLNIEVTSIQHTNVYIFKIKCNSCGIYVWEYQGVCINAKNSLIINVITGWNKYGKFPTDK